jgi:hypothetical protein
MVLFICLAHRWTRQQKAPHVTTAEPLVLHRHEQEPESPLGGLVYSAPFEVYLTTTLKTQQLVDAGQHADWWRNKYLAARLKAQMTSYAHGASAYKAILAMDRDGMDLVTAAKRCGQSEAWLRYMLVRFDNLKRAYHSSGRSKRRVLPIAS